MGTLIRAVTRYMPQTSLNVEQPTYQEYEVRLIQWSGCFTIQTPWSSLPATGDETDERLIAMQHNTFATPEEATAEAQRLCPHWDKNRELRDRLLWNVMYHGKTVGDGRTADEFDLPLFDVYDYARGKRKLPKGTKFREIAARAWH